MGAIARLSAAVLLGWLMFGCPSPAGADPVAVTETDVPLRDYFDLRFAEQEKAVAAALASAQEAVDKAEVNAEKWRDNANEWRGAMNDRERDFLTRKEFYSIVGTAVAVFSAVRVFGRYVKV